MKSPPSAARNGTFVRWVFFEVCLFTEKVWRKLIFSVQAPPSPCLILTFKHILPFQISYQNPQIQSTFSQKNNPPPPPPTNFLGIQTEITEEYWNSIQSPIQSMEYQIHPSQQKNYKSRIVFSEGRVFYIYIRTKETTHPSMSTKKGKNSKKEKKKKLNKKGGIL